MNFKLPKSTIQERIQWAQNEDLKATMEKHKPTARTAPMQARARALRAARAVAR
jgi:hypothetical protein